VPAITTRQVLALRHPEVLPTACDTSQGVIVKKEHNRMGFTGANTWFGFKQLDLTGIEGLVLKVGPLKTAGTLEVRRDTPDGPLLGSTPLAVSQNWTDQAMALAPADGLHDLYLVLRIDARALSPWRTCDIGLITFKPEEKD
jgi:hypothetical protein